MDESLNLLSEKVIGASISVHREFGPGLLESSYEACLEYELLSQGVLVERQKEMPVRYKGLLIDAGYRLDLWVERRLVIELKAVDHLVPIHEAQLMTYLKLSGSKLGLLINFNVKLLKDGIKRRIVD